MFYLKKNYSQTLNYIKKLNIFQFRKSINNIYQYSYSHHRLPPISNIILKLILSLPLNLIILKIP